MKVLIKSNEIIYISWVKHRLKENSIDFLVFDEFISSIEGNITAFPVRILVNEKDLGLAKKIISDDNI